MARIYLIVLFYHAYQKGAPRLWYFLIIIFPLFGGVFYLLYQLTQTSDAFLDKPVSTPSLGSRKKINHLEKELEFADTVRNRSLLADEYYKAKEYPRARQLYESCLSGHASEDLSTIIKLVDICFEEGRYDETIDYAKRVNGKSLFDKSVEKTAYAWAFYKEGELEAAEDVFKEMDSRYSHYVQRLEFAKFYKISGKQRAAQEVCRILMEEYESMHPEERKQKVRIFKEIKGFYDSIVCTILRTRCDIYRPS